VVTGQHVLGGGGRQGRERAKGQPNGENYTKTRRVHNGFRRKRYTRREKKKHPREVVGGDFSKKGKREKSIIGGLSFHDLGGDQKKKRRGASHPKPGSHHIVEKNMRRQHYRYGGKCARQRENAWRVWFQVSRGKLQGVKNTGQSQHKNYRIFWGPPNWRGSPVTGIKHGKKKRSKNQKPQDERENF